MPFCATCKKILLFDFKHFPPFLKWNQDLFYLQYVEYGNIDMFGGPGLSRPIKGGGEICSEDSWATKLEFPDRYLGTGTSSLIIFQKHFYLPFCLLSTPEYFSLRSKWLLQFLFVNKIGGYSAYCLGRVGKKTNNVCCSIIFCSLEQLN